MTAQTTAMLPSEKDKSAPKQSTTERRLSSGNAMRLQLASPEQSEVEQLHQLYNPQATSVDPSQQLNQETNSTLLFKVNTTKPLTNAL